MARIRRFTSRTEAELAASMLQAHGISAIVTSDDTGGMHPNLAYGFGGCEVRVPDEQLDMAEELLADHDDEDREGADLPPEPREPAVTAGGRWMRRWALLLAAVALAVVLLDRILPWL